MDLCLEVGKKVGGGPLPEGDVISLINCRSWGKTRHYMIGKRGRKIAGVLWRKNGI